MRPHAISLRETQDILSPSRIMALTSSLADAFECWTNEYGPHQAVLDTTARARILYCHFYGNVTTRLAGDRGAMLGEDQLQKYIVFDDRVLVRLKMLDGKLAARNYPTPHATEWVRQGALPGIPVCARLHLGYRLDLLGITLSEMFITLPNGIPNVVNDWVWQVWGAAIDSTFGQQAPFHDRANDPPAFYWHDDYSRRVGQ